MEISNSQMLCQSCNQQKFKLERMQSKLITSMELNLCLSCKQQGFEPKYIIIIAYRSGISLANEFIRKRKYSGEEISARDIVGKIDK